MELNSFKVIKEEIDKAELVLVGIGEEWQVSIDEMLANKRFCEMYQKLETKSRLGEGLPFLMKWYYGREIPKRLETAYNNLRKLLEGKNYFIVSTAMDAYLSRFQFQENRYVNPCGNFVYLQCDKGCRDELIPCDECVDDVEKYIEQLCGQDDLGFIARHECGEMLVFNNLYAGKYLERGYLDKWDVYMKWLQGTLNRRLVLLELGVGLQFPTVIRWPFEKTVMYNQKAVLFRIHEKLPMLTADIAKRGYSCHKNSVDVISTCKNAGISL